MRQTSQHLIEYVVVLLIRQGPDHPRLVQEVTVYLRSVQRPVGHLHLDEVALRKRSPFCPLIPYRKAKDRGLGKETYYPRALRVGGGLGGSQGPEDGEGGGQMLERVRLGTTPSNVEQLPEQQHRGVRLP